MEAEVENLGYNKAEYEFAKTLVGKKVLLLGGGQFANGFYVVSIRGFNDADGSIKIWDGKKEWNPIMWSYYVRVFDPELAPLTEGNYLTTGGDQFGETIIRRQDCGLFGTIYDCSVALRINPPEIEKRRQELRVLHKNKTKLQLVQLLSKECITKLSGYESRQSKEHLLHSTVECLLAHEFNPNNQEEETH